ncbi:type II secretion system F family protein [Candidatus Woesearchaeota archaeon]|nr:type II secretion system F family protein [Candidatus Woesearchaeota archaeon]
MISIVDVIHKISRLFPGLQKELRIAHIKQRPDDFIKRTLQAAFIFSLALSVFFFFIFSVAGISLVLILPILVCSFVILFLVLLQRPKTVIRKRERDLDREVLFAGRFLLVKIHSGTPLVNALYDASKSYGVSSKYFKEIVDDITMGTSVEKALDNSIAYTPSDKFRKIIFQISNAIKIGTDISDSLTSALDEISKSQMIEIQRYSKKLSSLTMFYMLLAIIMPSLGMAMLVVVGSLLGLFDSGVTISVFTGVIVFIVVVQVIFVTIFKSTRLSVNL